MRRQYEALTIDNIPAHVDKTDLNGQRTRMQVSALTD